MKLLAYAKAKDGQIYQPRVLSLSANRIEAYPGDSVAVNGSGFGQNEEVKITLQNEEYRAMTDKNGNFYANITIPYIIPKLYDIRAEGVVSGLSYSTSIRVW